MTPERATHLCRHIATLASVAEAHAFRAALREQGEELTSEVYAALLARIDMLNRREGGK